MYIYLYILYCSLCGAREEAGTVGDETKQKNKVEGVAAAKWVRTYLRPSVIYTHLHVYTYTGMYCLFFYVHGAREEAGTVGDNEIVVVAAAKVVTYVRT